MTDLSPALTLAERGFVPLPLLRWGVRRLLAQRLREEASRDAERFLTELRSSPIAVHPDAANAQHYELPVRFFELVLGPHLKYSGALWPEGIDDLRGAEAAMLDLYCRRADIEDGQDILDLGCGWGSLSLYMARCFPGSRITAVSNSALQGRFIETHAPPNVEVITADMNTFTPERTYDRIVSIEMLEHMRNYERLFARIASWLRPDGRFFAHVFCHRTYAYPFETAGAGNWLGRHFFTGGIMPSFDLLPTFDNALTCEQRWDVDGSHYARTARSWRRNLERKRGPVMEVLRAAYGREASVWYHRWRLFFLACEELFGYRNGAEWMVGHYQFRKRKPVTRSDRVAAA